MKHFYSIVALMAIAALCSFLPDGDDKETIVENVPTVQAFLKDPIPEADLQRIVNAGVNAPSGMNRQPWHFTVISSAEMIQQLGDAQKESMKGMKFPPMPPKEGMGPGAAPAPGGPDMKEGDRPKMPTGRGPKSGLGDSPVVIVISCKPGSEFDAGLACESMNDMANLMGYGTKIVSSVTMLFNGEKKAEYYNQFKIPEGQNIVAAILLGKVDCDAVTSETTRNPIEETVTFLK